MRAAHVRLIGLLVCTCLLTACGGGGGGGRGGSDGGGGSGGGGNTPPPPPNAAPTIENQAFSGTEDTPVSGLITAADPGDAFTFSVAANPAHGTLTSFVSTGQFTYTPAANFNGEDTFQVQVSDSRAQTATATMRVMLSAVNDPPSATNDVLQVTATDALTILANDVDVDGDKLTVEILGTPLVGTSTVNADGTVGLTLPAGFKGFTKFDYRITDAAGVTAQATAQAFVGIAPFSVIYYGVPTEGADPAIYLNDLFTNRRVHPPIENGRIEDLQVSADGSALAYVWYPPSGAPRVWYIDVANLGVQRSAVDITSEQIDRAVISPNGRYVATVLRSPRSPDTVEIFLFDAESTAPASRISLGLATHLLSWEPKFNAASTALYYLARTDYSGDSAVYRADLSTRQVTRVTPTVGGVLERLYLTFWVNADESRILQLRGVGGLSKELWVTPGGQPDAHTMLHEPSVTEPFYPSIAPNFDAVAIPLLNGADQDRLKVGRMSAPGSTVPAGPVEFVRYIDVFGLSETLRWRPDSGAFLATSATAANLARVYQVDLSDLDHPRMVNAPIPAGEGAHNGAYSSDGERITYEVNGLYKRELHVTTPATLGVTSTLVSPAGEYVAAYQFDPSGRVAIMTISAPLLLINVDAPGPSLRLADHGGSNLQAIRPRWP